MTLILSCETNDAVYQIADRRLTAFGSPDQIVDDQTNKIVIFDARVSFGYTGRSEICGQRTDEWLADVLQPYAGKRKLGLAVEAIRLRATHEFQKIRALDKFKFHAFQSVGWIEHSDAWRPGVITIHNGWDDAKHKWAEKPLDEFRGTIRVSRHGNFGIRLTAIGLPLHAAERAAVVRLLRSCAHRQRGSRAIRHAMFIAMRWLMQRHPDVIGGGMMFACIPRVAAEAAQKSGTFSMSTGGPSDEQSTFECFLSDGTPQGVGPIMVLGGASFRGIRFGRQ